MQHRHASRRFIWLALPIVLLLVGLGAYLLITSMVDLSGVVGGGEEASLQLPAGFTAEVFASGLNGPRFITFGPDGVLYVADRGANRIVTLPDADGDGTADSTVVFADGLNSPHSLVFHEGALYVGVPSGVIRLEDGDGDGTAESQTAVVDSLPPSGIHSTRTVAFLPDGRMVVAVGSSCNVCDEADERRAAVVVYDGADGGGERLFAAGLRNAVGLTIHPETGELWATNNGRDLLGDDLPPDSVYIVREGLDYGWPRCHAGDLPDPDFGGESGCTGVEQPVVDIQAHSAPLGLAFYTGTAFPADYQGDLFIALHGSWNRSEPTGYKVVRLPLNGSEAAGPLEDFAVGWLDEASGEAGGRPVGLAVGPDGALYISDDKGGYIYRIIYTGS
jgi:glucose/arabinose dehydrogenase